MRGQCENTSVYLLVSVVRIIHVLPSVPYEPPSIWLEHLVPPPPHPHPQVQTSSAALQTFVIKQVEPDPPAQEVSNYSKVRRLRSFTMLWVNTRGATLPRSKGFKLSPLSATKAAAASNWSIPSVMVFKNLQTKININWDFMNWTCNITILHS